MAPKPPARCTGKTKAGQRCKNRATQGGRCATHPDPGSPHPPKTGKPKKKAQGDARGRGSGPSLLDLAQAAATAPTPEVDLTRSMTSEEIDLLTRQQQALVRAIGSSVWNNLTAREQIAIRCLLLERGNVTRAAIRAGLQRGYYYHDVRSEAFETAQAYTRDIAVDLLDYEIASRGYAGTRKIVRYRGLPVPITDPRVPPILNPETGQPYTVPNPHKPDEEVVFRGYEEEIEYSDVIGLHVLKSKVPGYNPLNKQQVEVHQPDPVELANYLAAQLGVAGDEDSLDQSYKLTD